MGVSIETFALQKLSDPHKESRSHRSSNKLLSRGLTEARRVILVVFSKERGLGLDISSVNVIGEIVTKSSQNITNFDTINFIF